MRTMLLLPAVLLLPLSCTSTDKLTEYYERFVDALELSGEQIRERYGNHDTDDSTPEAAPDTEKTNARKEITDEARGIPKPERSFDDDGCRTL